MDKRYLFAYIVSAICIYFGVSMMIEGDPPPPETAPGQVVEVDPDDVLYEQGGDGSSAGGYMGTGRPQIKLVEAPEWPEDQTPPRPVAEMDSDQEYEGEARQSELEEVLKNLQGMDVYVEGVDGPTPKRR